jgi:hypothetical protein
LWKPNARPISRSGRAHLPVPPRGWVKRSTCAAQWQCRMYNALGQRVRDYQGEAGSASRRLALGERARKFGSASGEGHASPHASYRSRPAAVGRARPNLTKSRRASRNRDCAPPAGGHSHRLIAYPLTPGEQTQGRGSTSDAGRARCPHWAKTRRCFFAGRSTRNHPADD